MRISDWSSDVCSSDLLDQVGHRNAGDGRIADQRHHGVAMTAEHEGVDVVDRDVEFLGQEVAEARAVEHAGHADRSEEHTSELQSLMRISYAVFCLKKKNHKTNNSCTYTTKRHTYQTTHIKPNTLSYTQPDDD